MNGNPENKIHEIKIKNVKVGIICTRPVICEVTRVAYLFDKISIKKKKIQDNKQCVTIKVATKISVKESFHKIGIHKKFIS